ncbi:MAG TPA: DUF2695 domain-containing protein [Pyrinomonadaceae bacterium]
MPHAFESGEGAAAGAEEGAGAEAEAALPVAAGELRELLMWLDGKLSAEGCDDTNRHTAGFAEARGWPRAQLVEWLAAQGGYCDCEVLANVGEKWLD